MVIADELARLGFDWSWRWWLAADVGGQRVVTSEREHAVLQDERSMWGDAGFPPFVAYDGRAIYGPRYDEHEVYIVRTPTHRGDLLSGAPLPRDSRGW